ncbi:hypothetical protein Trihar35433_2247 [Trichoderma harzianum]|nr:hypothetical protein Trihar35433_2247 [Trichoderma harzianum]
MSTLPRTLGNLRKIGIKVFMPPNPRVSPIAGSAADIFPQNRITSARCWFVLRPSNLPRPLANAQLLAILLEQYIGMPSLANIPPSSSLNTKPLTNETTGDTKYGTLIGQDRFGNKYYENLEELPLRTRWVDYAKHDYDAAHIEPGWHAWISYSVDKPPTQDSLIATGTRHFEPALPKPNFTGTRGAYKPYNT